MDLNALNIIKEQLDKMDATEYNLKEWWKETYGI
jgi:hypothetical protein